MASAQRSHQKYKELIIIIELAHLMVIIIIIIMC